MADWNLPTLTTLYSGFLSGLKDRDLDNAKMLDPADVTVTNPVAGMKRWASSASRFEEYNGSAWVALVAKYLIDVDTVDGFHAGNASGNVPVSNGTLNTNLNADMVDGSHAGTSANNVLKLDGSGLVPQANIPSDIPWSKIISEPTTLAGYGITDALSTAGGTMTSGNLTLFQDPSSALHAATKQYVDGVSQGLDVKPSVLAATTTNITLSGAQTIDGVTCNAGARVLVKNQSTTSQNGIYVVAAGAWTRALDANTWDEHIGAFVFVEQGTVNADTAWVCTVNSGGTLGTTAVTFSQFAGPGSVTAGTGISVSGMQVSLATGNTLSLFNLAVNGLVARTAANTVTARSLSQPAAGFTISNSDGVSGNPTFALANDLSALEGLASTGFAVRTASDAWSQRTITGTTGRIVVTDGNGVAGNPTINIGSEVATLNTEDQALTGGVIVTSKSLGTISSGTVTPDPGDRPQQHYTNGGAHTLAPSTNAGSILVDITNNSTAGAITTSGFTKVSGDSFTTTDTHKFRCHISVGNGGSLLNVQALQ
jgi:hypothetical protein